MLLIQNEQRVLFDISIMAMLSLGNALGVEPGKTAETIRVQWHEKDGKWMLGFDILKPVPGLTEVQVRTKIVEVAKLARRLAAVSCKRNAETRFHK
jgi:hypothetical protein